MVCKLLAQHDLRFVAVVRNKLRLVDCALQRRWVKPRYRYDPKGHELYDELIRHLFSCLHGWMLVSSRHFKLTSRRARPGFDWPAQPKSRR